MPIRETRAYASSFCTTTDATPVFCAEYEASLNPGEAVWLEVRLKAANTTKSWYSAMIFFARRPGGGAPVIKKKELFAYMPEGKVTWDIDMVAVGLDKVALVCLGVAGTTIDWAVSTRGFIKFPF